MNVDVAIIGFDPARHGDQVQALWRQVLAYDGPRNTPSLVIEKKCAVGDGWVLVRRKGGHHQFRHPSKSGLVTVPHPKRDLPIGTVRSILRQAELEKR